MTVVAGLQVGNLAVLGCMSVCTLGMSVYWGGGGVLERPTNSLSVMRNKQSSF